MSAPAAHAALPPHLAMCEREIQAQRHAHFDNLARVVSDYLAKGPYVMTTVSLIRHLNLHTTPSQLARVLSGRAPHLCTLPTHPRRPRRWYHPNWQAYINTLF